MPKTQGESLRFQHFGFASDPERRPKTQQVAGRKNGLSDFEATKMIQFCTRRKFRKELNKVKAEKNDLDKDLIKKTEEYLLYLKKCRSELQKMAK